MLPSDSVNCYNKMRSFCGEKHYEDKEAILGLVDPSSVQEVEREEQKKLYENACTTDNFSVITYRGFMPPKLKIFFDEIGVAVPSFTLIMNSNLYKWQNHQLFGSYEQQTYWAPIGHSYQWGAKTRISKCLRLDTPKETMQSEFLHLHSPGTLPAEIWQTAPGVFYIDREQYLKTKLIKNTILAGREIGWWEALGIKEAMLEKIKPQGTADILPQTVMPYVPGL
jgi:hypothetical protein